MTTETYKGYTITIHQDENPMNPLEDMDFLGTFFCWHNRYTLGHKSRPDGTDTPEAFSNWAVEHGVIYLPIYMMDHSGLSLVTDPEKFRAWDLQGWDWGQIGWVAVTEEKARKEFGEDFKEPALATLQQEVKTYGYYVSAEVYGYTITKDGEFMDSCWGFYGYDYCLESAKAMVDDLEEYREFNGGK